MVSLDVMTSLFMNVLLDLAIEGISNRWSYIENIQKDEFISTIKFVLSSTYFTFNEKIYKQTFDMPMGSPLSPVVADIVMQDLEEQSLTISGSIISFYLRYVDDIILAASANEIAQILNAFNGYHNRL